MKWNWYNQSSQPLVDFDRLDASSRGAWGGLRVLKSCIRRPNWAALGALATIALLAFEPFTQAILASEDREVVLKPKEYAELARKNNQVLDWVQGAENGVGRFPVNPGNTTHYYVSFLTTSNIQSDMGLKAALWSGFSPLTSSQNLKPAYTCLSGNCSWADFASVAVCHKCHDLSQHVVRTTGTDKVPGLSMPPAKWEPNSTLPDISNQWPAANWWQTNQSLTHTKYKIASMNLSLSNYDGKASCTSKSDNCPDTYLSSRFTTNPGQTLNFQNHNTLIMAMQYLKSNKSWSDGRTIWEETGITSQECALFFCVNEYHDLLLQGSLQETVVASFIDRTTESYTPKEDDPMVEEFFRYTNYSLDMGNRLVLPISLWLRGGLFTRIVVLGVSSLMVGLGESNDIPSTIENVALSLTKWMRHRDLDDPEKGTSTANATIIHIRWYFFIFPIVNFVAGVIFTVLCIWETQRSGWPVWKDSILATLSCAPYGDLRKMLREAAGMDKLQDLSRSLVVTWHKDEGVGHLKET
ncbi:hypothetical protein NXS19_013937 [Fusarium pseudograminearum]|nr:hypothetical protein NXS19_013937 [Fusarium pseudograminearum]